MVVGLNGWLAETHVTDDGLLTGDERLRDDRPF